MKLTVLTPEKKLFDGEVQGVKLPGANGSFELLKDHAPIVAALDEGTMRIVTAEGVKNFDINSGFVECLNNNITVLVEGVQE